MRDAQDLSIGELSRRCGVKVTTIRFYEGIALMPEPPRSQGARRLYGAVHQQRLSFIRHARDLGFDIDDIRALLDLSDRPDRSCAEADVIVRRHLAAVEDKIARLTGLRDELNRMVAECGRGTVADCRVIDTLADHGKCEGGH